MTAVAALWRSVRVRQVLELLSDKAWPQGEQAHSDPKGKTALHVAAASGSIRMLWAMVKCGKFCQHLGPELRQQEADTSRIKPKQQRERERERERETERQRKREKDNDSETCGTQRGKWLLTTFRLATRTTERARRLTSC